MNTSFWSHCQGLVRRLEQRRRARPRQVPQLSAMVETLEARALLSSTPAMIADINVGTPFKNPVAIGSTIFFVGDDGVHGKELWKSDGTTAGTMMVKDISPGGFPGYAGGPDRAGSDPANLTNVNGTLFFTATDSTHSYELWKSDGTAEGTVMVKDIFPGSFTGTYGGVYPNGSAPGNLTSMNGTLYFTASDSAHGRELWKSDGTAAGTVMVKDLLPGNYSDAYGTTFVNSSNPAKLTNVNGTLYFTASSYGASQYSGQLLWKSDGTPDGTTLIGGGADPTQFTSVNGALFFAANGPDGIELWKSDGTASGTTQVKDIFPGMSKYYQGNYGGYVWRTNSSNPTNLTSFNGQLYFLASDGGVGNLWRSDGTAAGTVKITGLAAINGNQGITQWNGSLYFGSWNGTVGNELWKSDGTTAGTTLVKDIYSGSNSSYPSGFTNFAGTLFFTAVDGVHGRELWKTDGTAAGTVLVQDISPGSDSSTFGLTNANGTLFFFTYGGVHGNELWALNAPAPPVAITSLSVSGVPVTTTAGNAFSFTVTAKNADGSPNTSYIGKVHFNSTDPQAVLPADYTFTAADQGAHTFTANLKTAGSRTITATDTQSPGMSAASSNILVKSAVESTMIVSGFAPTITAGTVGSVSVTLKDPYGNIATGYVGTVHFTSSDPKAVLPTNYTFTAADAGIHTFNVTLKTAGTQWITAGGVIRLTLTGTQSGIKVNPAAASQFLISGAPTSVRAGAAFSLTLTVTDAYGNVVTGYTGKVRFTSTDSSAKLPANYTFTASDKGVHTFSNVVLRKKGNQKINVFDTLSSLLTASVTVSVR